METETTETESQRQIDRDGGGVKKRVLNTLVEIRE